MSQENLEYLVETGVHWLGDQRVSAANIWDREYTLPDGTARTGLTASLFITGKEPLIVGPGSVFTVGTSRYEVIAIENPQGKRGTVTVRLIEA
jgi:hypothetical protein